MSLIQFCFAHIRRFLQGCSPWTRAEEPSSVRGNGKKRFLLPGVFLFLLAALPAGAAGKESSLYDVVVAGGGAGGVSAAISAARLGVRVALLEETDWLGGQMTAAGVSTMDDLSGNKTGVYGEFFENVRYHYFLKGKSISTAYWDGNTVAFEPSVGRSILEEMVKKAGKIHVFYRAKVREVLKEGTAIRGVVADVRGKVVSMGCAVLVDATEWGDVLPLAGALYRAGNSVSPLISGQSRIQDITWTAVIKKYPGGIPARLRISTPPPSYEKYVQGFRSVVLTGGNSFRAYPLRMPVDFPTHNGYRGIPDSSNPGDYSASSPEGWSRITKTGVNWANDFPGVEKWEGRGGLPVAYLEDMDFRRRVNSQAMLKTLGFLYYIQNELNEPWSVADDEFDGPEPVDLSLGVIPGEYGEILRRLPPLPYVRESRRLVGMHTLTSKEVRFNSESYRDGREGREIPDALAIAGYIIDLHAGDEDGDLESEFGEKYSSIRTDMPRGPFQIPFGCFIPREVDGLLAAEKNISVSRLVSGAVRLQPISMLTGQAAGIIAALSAMEGKTPRRLDPRQVQRHLLEAGSALSLCEYSDVPRGHPFWPGVQMSNLYGWLKPEELPSAPSAKINDLYNNKLVLARLFGLDKGVFGVDSPLTGAEAESLFQKAFNGDGKGIVIAPGSGPSSFVSRKDFAAALARALGYRFDGGTPAPRFADIDAASPLSGQIQFLWERGTFDAVGKGGVFMPESFVSRGAAVDMVMRGITALREQKPETVVTASKGRQPK